MLFSLLREIAGRERASPFHPSPSCGGTRSGSGHRMNNRYTSSAASNVFPSDVVSRSVRRHKQANSGEREPCSLPLPGPECVGQTCSRSLFHLLSGALQEETVKREEKVALCAAEHVFTRAFRNEDEEEEAEEERDKKAIGTILHWLRRLHHEHHKRESRPLASLTEGRPALVDSSATATGGSSSSLRPLDLILDQGLLWSHVLSFLTATPLGRESSVACTSAAAVFHEDVSSTHPSSHAEEKPSNTKQHTRNEFSREESSVGNHPQRSPSRGASPCPTPKREKTRVCPPPKEEQEAEEEDVSAPPSCLPPQEGLPSSSSSSTSLTRKTTTMATPSPETSHTVLERTPPRLPCGAAAAKNSFRVRFSAYRAPSPPPSTSSVTVGSSSGAAPLPSSSSSSSLSWSNGSSSVDMASVKTTLPPPPTTSPPTAPESGEPPQETKKKERDRGNRLEEMEYEKRRGVWSKEGTTKDGPRVPCPPLGGGGDVEKEKEEQRPPATTTTSPPPWTCRDPPPLPSSSSFGSSFFSASGPTTAPSLSSAGPVTNNVHHYGFLTAGEQLQEDLETGRLHASSLYGRQGGGRKWNSDPMSRGPPPPLQMGGGSPGKPYVPPGMDGITALAGAATFGARTSGLPPPRSPALGLRRSGFQAPFQHPTPTPVMPSAVTPTPPTTIGNLNTSATTTAVQEATTAKPPTGNSTPAHSRSTGNEGKSNAENEESGMFEAADYPKCVLLPDGSVPLSLQSIDPKLVYQVTREIVENRAMDDAEDEVGAERGTREGLSNPKRGPRRPPPGAVTWEDIAGLQEAKKSVEEAVVWPLRRPDLFVGLRDPPRGLLLFGPPGTGKTLIARAIATRACCTFFSISASSLMSKWYGEAEQLVRCLFAVATLKQPSVIFVDEVDSLLSMRGESDGEAARRLKTEFLVQMDGVGTKSTDRVLLIGATNRPEELDEAARRRLEKRLYIPLPDAEARLELIQRLLASLQSSSSSPQQQPAPQEEAAGVEQGQESTEDRGRSERGTGGRLEKRTLSPPPPPATATSSVHALSSEDLSRLVKATEGYSGADIRLLCREAAMAPLREATEQLMDWERLSVTDLRPLRRQDFKEALCRIRPSVGPSELTRYESWNQQFGSFHHQGKDAWGWRKTKKRRKETEEEEKKKQKGGPTTRAHRGEKATKEEKKRKREKRSTGSTEHEPDRMDVFHTETRITEKRKKRRRSLERSDTSSSDSAESSRSSSGESTSEIDSCRKGMSRSEEETEMSTSGEDWDM